MDATRLVAGYKSVLQRIYNCDAYYKRVMQYLSRTKRKPGESSSKQRWPTPCNVRAFVTSIFRQGVFGRERRSYWRFLMIVATRYRRCFGAAMTLAVMGHHFQIMTRRLLNVRKEVALSSAVDKSLSGDVGGQST